MYRRFLLFLLVVCHLFFGASTVSAVDRPHFVSFVNPVRGEEGWISKQSPLDLPILQYLEATKSASPVTWLLRYDAVSNATISGFFRDLTATDGSQTLGVFLEITPNLAAASGVSYPEGETFMAANRVFLSGYSRADRIKLIDVYMEIFYRTFGYYPNVVGAWHIDAYSLDYLSHHYSVITAIICDEQYTTDNYRFWGGYLGSPYFPSKTNFLVPATSRDNRIPIVVTKWAARDPFNFYGTRSESLYSFQINDYTAIGQSTKFFEDLLSIYSQDGLNEFSQINIGLENDYDINIFRNELKRTFSVLRQNQTKNNLKFISLADFGAWMTNRYTFTNPVFFYQAPDITGKKEGMVYWYQNPFYRIGLRSFSGRTEIIDFRLYNQAEAEEHYLTKNTVKMLYAETNPLVDSVKYPGTTLDLDINLTKAKISYSGWKVIFSEGEKEIRFEPEKIIFLSFNPPSIPSDELRIVDGNNQTTWHISPRLPFSTSARSVVMITILVALFAIFIFKKNKTKMAKLILILGWLIGTLSLITVIRSGLIYYFGLGFWGPNGHDALFHLSLAENFRSNFFSLSHPQLAGEFLKNYHFGFDWIAGLFSRLTTIPLIDVYFRAFPLFLILSVVFVTLALLSLWRFSLLAKMFSLLFIFFAGSAGFIPSFLFGKSPLGGESFFWANQSISLLLNPPFALSILILLVFLFLLERHPHRLSVTDWLLLSILGGLLVQIKIYAFILLFLSLIINRKIKLSIGVGIFGGLFVLPSLGGLNGFPFVLQPLWFARSMFESTDRLYWQRLAQAWQVYENNGIFIKLLLVNLFAVVIFYIGNLWVRLVGVFRLIRSSDMTLSAKIGAGIVSLGLVIPLVITQKVNPWNTIQFLYYSLFFLGFFTAEELGRWFFYTKRKLLSVIVIIFLFILSLPTTLGTLSDYVTSQSASRISLTELRALDRLRSSPRGVVAAPLLSDKLPFIPDPRPLYAYASTAYISAISGQPEYLGDTINLDITGYNYGQRAKNIKRLYQTRDPIWVKQFFDRNRIKYVYETPFAKLLVRQEDVCLEKIFDSGEINLYKYSCHD